MANKDYFSEIIGYESAKQELRKVADILKDPKPYKDLGIKEPHGLLLDGQPGVGKTLMAKALIKASGRTCFICRKNKPGGEMVKQIESTFKKAAQNQPSIVFLDDMDKFTNGNYEYPDAEEYVTVQSCMDDVKDKDVFVLATTNSLRALPKSLKRAGRFDRRITVQNPVGDDAKQIIKHYLKNKNVDKSIDVDTLARLLNGDSCAELESIINEAGIYAGYERSDTIKMKHMMKAFLREDYETDSIDDTMLEYNLKDQTSIMPEVIYHEAGHTLIADILNPGSVTYTSVLGGRNTGGLTKTYVDANPHDIKWKVGKVVEGLGGMAATEQKFGAPDSGAHNDLDRAYSQIYELISDDSLCGFPFHSFGYDTTEEMKSKIENQACSELERIYKKAKEIISKNTEYFEKIASALARKHLVTTKDLEEIRNNCEIIPVEIM